MNCLGISRDAVAFLCPLWWPRPPGRLISREGLRYFEVLDVSPVIRAPWYSPLWDMGEASFSNACQNRGLAPRPVTEGFRS